MGQWIHTTSVMSQEHDSATKWNRRAGKGHKFGSSMVEQKWNRAADSQSHFPARIGDRGPKCHFPVIAHQLRNTGTCCCCCCCRCDRAKKKSFAVSRKTYKRLCRRRRRRWFAFPLFAIVDQSWEALAFFKPEEEACSANPGFSFKYDRPCLIRNSVGRRRQL